MPDPLDAIGVARILPEDRVIELSPRPYPTAPEAPDEAPAPEGLAFEFVAEQSLRYRFELRDSTGLANPDPGLFSPSFTTFFEASR